MKTTHLSFLGSNSGIFIPRETAQDFLSALMVLSSVIEELNEDPNYLHMMLSMNGGTTEEDKPFLTPEEVQALEKIKELMSLFEFSGEGHQLKTFDECKASKKEMIQFAREMAGKPDNYD